MRSLIVVPSAALPSKGATMTAQRKKTSAELFDQSPPSALESEVAVLAGFMLQGRVDPDCDLRADQFYDQRNGTMYNAMVELEAEIGRWDDRVLIGRLQSDRLWSKDGFDAAYVATIAMSGGSSTLGPYHSRQIKDTWRRRMVGQHALELFQLSHNGFDPDKLHESLESIKRVYDGDGGVRIGQAVSRTLDTITPKRISWLWPNRIPLGKYTEWIGYPGVGKTVVLCDIMARVSAGLPCPDSNASMGPGGVVFMTAEDDPADTIRPRLDAAGADCSRIRLLEAVGSVDSETGRKNFRSISLDRDVPAIEEAVNATPDCRLIVIDPITAYCGKTDSHKAAEVRALLVPLTELASKHNIAVVGITHFNKGGGGGPAVGRGMGSLAWVAAARMAWGIVKDAENPGTRLMLPIKCNIAGDVSGLSYSIVDRDGVPVVEWSPDAVRTTVDEALGAANANGKQSPKKRDVKAWLKAKLVGGAIPANDVLHDGQADGFSEKLLRWAKKEMNVSSYAEGFGSDAVWFWSLPNDE